MHVNTEQLLKVSFAGSGFRHGISLIALLSRQLGQLQGAQVKACRYTHDNKHFYGHVTMMHIKYARLACFKSALQRMHACIVFQ